MNRASLRDAVAAGRRFKRYPAYRDSSVEWLGAIPTHWVLSKAGVLTTAISGSTPSRDNPLFWHGGIPWVTPKDMKRAVVDSSEETVSDAGVRASGLRLVPSPAVLIVVRGMILAHTFPVAVTAAPVTINQDMKGLRTTEEIAPAFLAQVLRGAGTALLGQLVEDAAHGTKAIRMERWRSFPIPVPPLAEQHAIAAFVDQETATLDTLLTRVERLAGRVTNPTTSLLHEYRTALICAAVTGKIDVQEEAA